MRNVALAERSIFWATDELSRLWRRFIKPIFQSEEGRHACSFPNLKDVREKTLGTEGKKRKQAIPSRRRPKSTFTQRLKSTSFAFSRWTSVAFFVVGESEAGKKVNSLEWKWVRKRSFVLFNSLLSLSCKQAYVLLRHETSRTGFGFKILKWSINLPERFLIFHSFFRLPKSSLAWCEHFSWRGARVKLGKLGSSNSIRRAKERRWRMSATTKGESEQKKIGEGGGGEGEN